jgi:ribonuclease Y
VITIEWLYVVAGLLAGAVIAWLLTAFFYNKGYSKQSQELLETRQKMDEEAIAIVGEAIKTGEDKKREILLSVKEEVHKAKIELERDVRERRHDLTRERQRIDQKETVLDRRAQSLEDREENFRERETDLSRREDDLTAIEAEKRTELERIASLSVQDAREIAQRLLLEP